MSNPFKDLIRKTALKAQEAFNIDESKTERFLAQADKVINKTSEKIGQFEKATNQLEETLKTKAERFREALKNDETPTSSKPIVQSPQEQVEPEVKPVTKKSVAKKAASKKATSKTVAKKTVAKKATKKAPK